MTGALLIIFCSILWATDALFRLPLLASHSAGTIVLAEHLICVAVTFPFFVKHRRELSRFTVKSWLSVAFIGAIGSALGTFLFTSSYKYVNPSVTILIQKLQPVFAIAGARIFLREVPKSSFYLWAFLALLAGTMVSIPEFWRISEFMSTAQLTGITCALGAAMAWGLSTVFGKWVSGTASFQLITFLRFAWGLLGVSIIWSVTHQSQMHFVTDRSALLKLVYIALVPGVLALLLYYAGLKQTKASLATFLEMFFPVSAVIVNWIWLGQALSVVQILGMVLLSVSVFFINRGL